MFREQQEAPAEQLTEPESHPRVLSSAEHVGRAFHTITAMGNFKYVSQHQENSCFCNMSRINLLGMCIHVCTV